jgi:RNA polymerase sigma-70 factor (ECF subfamily)
MSETEDPRAEQRRWFQQQILPLEPALLAYARHLARRTPMDAEDLVHDVFARAISTPAWREIENPAAFAKRVLHNLAIDALRRRRIVAIDAVADLEALGTADDAPGPEATILARDELQRLQAIVANLPDQCRKVFTLRKIYHRTNEEIAVQLGLSVSTVEKHLAKALRLCAEQLAAQEQDQEPRWNRTWRRNRQS